VRSRSREPGVDAVPGERVARVRLDADDGAMVLTD
jgi:hypothetical protein